MEQEIKLSKILQKINSINDLFSRLNKELIFFSPTHQRLRCDIENEAAWLNNIDFYYGLFYERCDIYWDYIFQKVMVYGGDYEGLKEGKAIFANL